MPCEAFLFLNSVKIAILWPTPPFLHRWGRVKFGEEELSKPNFTPSVQRVAPVGNRVTEIPAYAVRAAAVTIIIMRFKTMGYVVCTFGAALW